MLIYPSVIHLIKMEIRLDSFIYLLVIYIISLKGEARTVLLKFSLKSRG